MADSAVADALPRICLTGATRYVGGRLLTVLQRDGCRVRCVARRPESLARRLSDTTEAVHGDQLDRASVVIGSGSVSFEMVRALVERLPVMITPRWVSVAARTLYGLQL